MGVGVDDVVPDKVVIYTNVDGVGALVIHDLLVEERGVVASGAVVHHHKGVLVEVEVDEDVVPDKVVI